jgi:hypothetical protein
MRVGTGTNSAEIVRRPVTKLEYVDEETLVSGSEDGTMRVWSVATGTQKEELDGEGFAFSLHASSLANLPEPWQGPFSAGTGQPYWHNPETKESTWICPVKEPEQVGKYSITFKDDLVLISGGQSVVAFFRAPHVISSIGTAGERIAVGCKNGEVLQLRAPWLV